MGLPGAAARTMRLGQAFVAHRCVAARQRLLGGGSMPTGASIAALRAGFDESSAATILLDAARLAEFRARRLVVLSPHFDDACFSLGAFLTRMQSGDLINIFTQGDHVARRAPRPDRQSVFALRDAEDAAFAARCSLKRHDLGCEEPSVRGRRPSQLKFLEDDFVQIVRPLLGKLEGLAAGFAPGARGVVLAPLGIGRHVNHRAIAALVQNFLPLLQANYDLYLYEDQPYARNLLDRICALYRARRRLRLGTRHVLPTPWPEKKPLVELYASQLKGPARACDYWPLAPAPWRPHEAFWSVIP